MEFSSAILTREKDQRLEKARKWLAHEGVDLNSDFINIAGDASFRRYFRLTLNGESRILMDAPPPGENVEPFVDIAGRLREAGLHAPKIFLSDLANGFLLLEDLGDDLYRGLLHKDNANDLFPSLFDTLKTLALDTNTKNLPEFDHQKFRRDMGLFPDWYLARHRKQQNSEWLERVWDDFCHHIIQSAFDQPQAFVHRDFHSCNLIRTRRGEIGIIDFQDAVRGPVSYDFISLIWDRYISWPRLQIVQWMETMRLKLGLDMEPMEWQRCCDLMGLQRNFKIVGIFARLHYRDQKEGYLEMIPRFYEYLTSTLRLYPEFKDVLVYLERPECEP